MSAAAALGDRATLTRLVSGLGLSITAPDGYGMTPLMWACTAPPATAAGTVASVLGLLGAPDGGGGGGGGGGVGKLPAMGMWHGKGGS